ncbi:MAG: type II toxin-antitoxin system RelE/ParE family toxin [Acetobacteraceae bacterium]|nr:type II toxin-antitoxin system RelE/ParE family toxin [Acetobacteraceae bacterium]
MLEIITTVAFDDWLRDLRDRKGRAVILMRLRRLAGGNPGDAKPVGDGIGEMRIDFGPGYRVYFLRRSQIVIIVLAGGDKSTQPKDIAAAKIAAADWKD